MASQFIIDDVENPLKTTSSNPMGSADFKKVPSNFTAEELNSFTNLWLDYSQISLTIPYIQSILVNATQGFSQNQAALFTAILDKEPLLVAHFQTRKLAVLGLDWTITGGSEAKQEMLKKTLEDAGLNKLMDHLLSALQYGYAGAAINWGAGGGKIRDFRYIDPVNWSFDKRGNVALWTAKGEQTVLTAENAAQFVFHAYNPKPGIPSTGGLLRSLVWTYFFKHTAVKHQARFLEKFGIPFLITQISENDFRDDTIRNKIKSELRSIGADGAGVVTQQAKVDTLNATTQQANFLGWIKYNDDAYAISILGQLASSSAGGGFSKDQAQENVRRDIMEADARSLADTISSQILRPLEMFKFGTHECKFEIDYKPALDVAEKVKTIQALNAVGLKAQKQWIEDTVGVPLESEEEKPTGKTLPELPASKAVPGLPMTPSPTDLLGGTPSPTVSAAPPTPALPEAPTESAAPEAMNDSGSKKNLIAFDDGWSPVHEFEFRNWYSQYALENNLNPDPDAEGLGKENRELWNKAVVPEDFISKSGIPQITQTSISGEQAQIPDASALDVEDNTAYLQQLMSELEEKAKTSSVGKLADASEQQIRSYFDSVWNKLPAKVQDSFDKTKLYDQFRSMRYMFMGDPNTSFSKIADAKQYSLSPEERTTWEKNKEAFSRGSEDFISSLAGISDLVLGGVDPKVRDFNKKFQEYRKLEEKDDAIKGEDWLADTWYSTVRMVPSTASLLGLSVLTGGVAAPALGLGGLATTAVAAIPAYLQGAGDIYNTIVDAGVDRDIASLAALAGAMPYAALEQSQLGKLLGRYAPKFLPYKDMLKTGGSKAITDAVKKHGADKVEKAMSQYWKNSLLKPGASFALDVGKEAGQEVLQDIVSSMSETGAAYVNDVLRGTNLMETQPDLAERLQQFGNTFVQSIGPMFLMTLGGRAGGKVYSNTLGKKVEEKKKADAEYALRPDRFVTRLSINDMRSLDDVLKSLPIPDLKNSPEFVDFIKEHKNLREALDTGYLSYEFVNSEKLPDLNATIDYKDGVYKLAINTDEINTPEKLINIFGHEDFGHRFLYGTNNAISAKRRGQLENVINELSKNADWWSPKANKVYEEFYAKQGVPPERIEQLLLEEKVVKFFEAEAWKKLPKDSKLKSFFSEVVMWLKETFPKVFGEMSEADALQILSNVYQKYKTNSLSAVEAQAGERAKATRGSLKASTKDIYTFRRLVAECLKAKEMGAKSERELLKDKLDLIQAGSSFLNSDEEMPQELTTRFEKDAHKLTTQKLDADEFGNKLGDLVADYLTKLEATKKEIGKTAIRKVGAFASAQEFYDIIKPTDVSWIDLPQSEKRLYEACYSYSNRFAQTSTMDTQLEKSRYSNELLDNLAKDFAVLREQYAGFGTMADAVQANIANYLTQSAQLFGNNAAGFNELNKTLSAAREITDEKKRMDRLFQIYKAIDTRLNLWTREAQNKFTQMLNTQKEKLADKLEKIKIPAYPENFEGLTSEEQMLAFLQRYSTQSVQSREQLRMEYNKYLAHPEEMTGFDSKAAEVELAKTPVYEMDMTKLPDAMFDLQSLAKEERILRQERKRLSNEYLSEVVAKSTQDIVDTHGRPNRPIESPWQNIKDVFQKTFNLVLMPDQIPNWLVGFKESPFVQVLYTNLVNASQYRKSLEARWFGVLEPMLKEAGISRHVHQADIELQGEKFTLSQIMGIYAWSLNEKSSNHLRGTFKEKYEPLMEDVNKLLSSDKYIKYKTLVGNVITFYDSQVYPEVDKLYYRQHGVHLPKEANYFPINSLDYMVVNKKTAFEMFVENFGQKGIQRPLDNFTKERSPDSQIPFKSLDFFKALSTNVGDVSNFVGMYESVDFAKRLLNNNELRETINRINPIWYEKLVDQVNIFADNRPGSDPASRLCDIMRGNIGAAILGFNIPAVLMQPAAIFPGIVDVALKNPRALVSAVKEMSGMSLNARQHSLEVLVKSIYDKSEFMRNRSSRYGYSIQHWINTALSSELKGMNLALTVLEDVKQWSFVGLQSMDNVCSCYVWNANYKSALIDGKSEAEAIAIADEVVRKTQQINDPELMPKLFTNQLTKMFAQFQLPVTQLVNMVVRDWMSAGYKFKAQGLEAKETQAALKKAAAQLVFGFGATAFVTYLIRNAFEDLLDTNEDAEKKFKKMALGTVSESLQMMVTPIAFFGPTIADQIQASADTIRRDWLKEPISVRKVDGVTPPVMSMLWQLGEGFFKSAQSVAKFGIEGAWDRGELTNFDMYRGVMGAAGLPFIGPSRIYRQWDKFEKYGDPRYLMFGSSKLDSKYPISQGLAYEIPEYDKKMEEQGLGFRFTAPSKVVSYKVSNKLTTWFVLDDADYETYWNLATEYFKASYSPYKPQYDEKEMKKAWSDAKKRAQEALSSTWKVKYADAFTRNLKGFNDMSTMSFAELTAEELKKKGTDLIRLLKGITSAKAQAATLKEEIMPYAANQPVETDEGTIVYVEGSEGQVMNRTVLRNKMVEMFKIDPARAEALLNSASAKKLIDAYLKVMKKKKPAVVPKATTEEAKPEVKEEVKQETPNV